MKRAICLFFVIFLFLCGCSQKEKYTVVDFSYKSDYSCYKDEPGVKESGFVNTEKCELKTAEQAIKLAKKECTVRYNTIDVAFDSDLKIYRVSFYKENQLGGDQNVYISDEGVTLLIVFGE